MRVLVTGATGFVGGHLVCRLLADGFEVRGTVRNPAESESRVRDRIKNVTGSDPGDRLQIVGADLMVDAGWDRAVEGCAFVHHVASPFPARQPRHDDDLVKPAREGALRVVRAAARAGVKRVIQTSSTAAVSHGQKNPPRDRRFTEANWTEPAHADNTPYTRSKTIAERDARAAARELGVEFVSVNPSAILGPVFDGDLSTSIELVRRPLAGEIPGSPRLGYSIVDVRDLADAHVRAMTAEGIDGERFIVSGAFLWMADIVEILRRRYPDRADRISTRKIPDVALRAMAFFDPVLREPARHLNQRTDFDVSHARTRLGWTPRREDESIIDTAESLIRCEIV